MNNQIKREKSNFTPEQRCAVYTKGSDILVSAGAGSGKTKVLTQRIYIKLLQGVDISNLLVLTFTNAAAAEMKTRLKDRIKYALEPKPNKDKECGFDEPTLIKDLNSIAADDEDFLNPEDKVFKDPTVIENLDTFKAILKDQYNKIDSALVTTFDSFALGVIKKYHYEFGLDKNVKIANDNVLSLKKAVIMDEVFEGLYQEENESFGKLLELYTHKSDSELRKTLVKLADKVKKYLRNGSQDVIFESYKELYYNDVLIDSYINEYEKIINEELNSIVSYAITGADIYQQKKAVLDTKLLTKGKLSKSDNDNREKYALKITLMDGYANFFSNTRSYDEIQGFYNVNEPQKTNRHYDPEVNIFLKKYKDISKKYLLYASVSKIKDAINGSLETIEIIVKILKRYFTKYDQFKKDLGIYEFDDISKNVLNKFGEWNKEIESNPFIVNPLVELRNSFEEILLDEYQDTSDIQEDFMNYIKRDNMYMVGDMKQSIYRFRDANPYLFKHKYNTYAVHNGDRRITEPTRINLTFNFRSRKEVLDNINLMFDNLMSDDCGDADYQNGHRMVYGRKKYDQTIVPNFNYDQEYLYYNQEENSEYDALKLEAYIVAKKIKEIMDNPDMKVVNKEDETFNKIQYSDFAVIIPRIDTARYYQEVFEELKIPYNLKVSEKIKDCKLFVVIISLINLIKIIDDYEKVKNKQYKTENDKEIINDFKYYFTSVARSFLFNISDGKILEYMLNGLETSEVYEKTLALSEYAKKHSITTTFEQMVKEFKFYESFVRIGDVDKYLYVLDYLQKTVSDLASLGYDFGNIAEHFEEVKEKDIETKIDSTIDKNAVIIVNIHKSKGLEYPICFFTDLDARFNTSDVEANFIFSKNHGFIAPFFENGRFETLVKFFFKDKYLKEDISEHVRLFYVALTRAREKMYFVVPEPKQKKNDDDEEEESFSSYTSFIETYFEQAVKDYKQLISEEEITEFLKDVKHDTDEENDIPPSRNVKQPVVENPYELSHKPWKYEKTIVESDRMSMELGELISDKTANNLETGNRLHEILQSINLVEVSKNINTLDSLKISSSDAGIIKNILKLPCFANLENTKIYKEFEFIYDEEIEQEGNKINKTRHGIIDLLVEYNDHFDIIDYKTNNIDKDEYVTQLNGYRKYLEKIIRSSGKEKYVKMYLVSLVQGKQKEVPVV